MNEAVQLMALWGDESKAKCMLLSFREGFSRQKRKMLRDTLKVPCRAVFDHAHEPHQDCTVCLSLQSLRTLVHTRARKRSLVIRNPIGTGCNSEAYLATDDRVFSRSVCLPMRQGTRPGCGSVDSFFFFFPALHGRSHFTIQPACLFAGEKPNDVDAINMRWPRILQIKQNFLSGQEQIKRISKASRN